MAYDTFARPTGIDWGSADKTFGQVRFGEDSQQVVLFYTRSVFNAMKSQANGSRHYENEIWVKLHPPGERLNVIDRPVTDIDKVKYPQQWNMFLQNKTQVPEGTPIDLLFPNSPATADNLKAFGVHTVQQCAKLSAHAQQTIGMGATEWMNMAKQYLDSASSGTAFLALRAELSQKDTELRVMKQQYDKLKAQLDDLLQRFNNPQVGAATPQAFADAAQQQILANHPSNRRPNKSFSPPPASEVEQAGILRQITEQDFPTVDVTSDQEQVADPTQSLDFGLGT